MRTNTLILGLTGQTGAGKSTVSRMFGERGIPVLDADEISRDTIDTSIECRMDLVLEYTTAVIRADASLNRERLAEICFSDPMKLKKLNQIVYPYIVAEIARQLDGYCARGEPMVVLDAPTLYESGLEKRCARVVAVLAEEETRLQRILARDRITEEAARRRINAQNKDDFYLSRTEDVLRNDGGMEDLRLAFAELYDRFERLSRGEEAPALILQGENLAKQDFEELTDAPE